MLTAAACVSMSFVSTPASDKNGDGKVTITELMRALESDKNMQSKELSSFRVRRQGGGVRGLQPRGVWGG